MLDSALMYVKQLLSEAVKISAYINHRQPSSALKDPTSYEAFYGTKPSIQLVGLFCRECYIHRQYLK